MAILPEKVTLRRELDNRIGIKSSLKDLSSIIGLLWALYKVSSKKTVLDYSVEFSSESKTKIKLKPEYQTSIESLYDVTGDILNSNPLLTSQLESLQVGLGLMFKLAQINFTDFPNSDIKERTGGERFRKTIRFSSYIELLDLFISAWDDSTQKQEISLWIKNSPSNSQFSEGLKKILSILSEDVLFKIRSDGKEIIFQQEGIYHSLLKEETVIAKDEQEDVGPMRILKSIIKENLHPLLVVKNHEFQSKNKEELSRCNELIKTMLDLSPRRHFSFADEIEDPNTQNDDVILPLQAIYYGAPGTGKSYKIKSLEKGKATKPVRTTFHPDSDYSTFVGAYKPTMEVVPRYDSSTGNQVEEKRIAYNYVPQAFLKAYVQAWENYPEPQYLVIEEINRGNCAQIFGDLFQLLDRSASGFSEYPIAADSDINKYLLEVFSEEDKFALTEEQRNEINALYEGEYANAVANVQSGEFLLLPKNLHILATMNTSDQSLFPIDSAFKRRWEWEYVPIRNANKGWVIAVDGEEWDWWSFLMAINAKIGSVTDSEDKKLGYFFVKPSDNHTITAETFVSKVIFYLWNDVFKDYGFSDEEFQTKDGKGMSFPMFYETENEDQRVNEALIAQFLQNVVGNATEVIQEGETAIDEA